MDSNNETELAVGLPLSLPPEQTGKLLMLWYCGLNDKTTISPV